MRGPFILRMLAPARLQNALNQASLILETDSVCSGSVWSSRFSAPGRKERAVKRNCQGKYREKRIGRRDCTEDMLQCCLVDREKKEMKIWGSGGRVDGLGQELPKEAGSKITGIAGGRWTILYSSPRSKPPLFGP